MAPLATFVPPPSPIDAITKALGVAEHVYGIKGAAQKAQQIQQALDLQAQQNDPTSAVSQERQASAGALLHVLPNNDQTAKLASLIPKMSATNLAADPNLNAMVQMKERQMQAEAMAAMNAPRARYYNTMANLRTDDQANHAAAQFDSDPLIKQYNGQIGQIGKAFGLLNSSGPLIGQTANELATDMGTILANGRAAGLDQTNKQEYNSAQGALAQAQQWLTGHPQDAMPEPLRETLREQFGRLYDAVNQQRSLQVQRLAVGRGYQNNPSAQAALEAKIASYENPTATNPTVVAPSGGAGAGLPVGGASAGEPAITPDIRQAALNEIHRRRSSKGK